MSLASESGHWYYAKTGEPCYEMPKKDGSGMRKTTLRDFKKLSGTDEAIVPSVTGICKMLRNYGIDVYKENQLLEACYTSPVRRDDIPFDEWKIQVKKDAEEHAKVAREKGTLKHADIEKYFLDEVLSPDIDTYNQIVKIAEILDGYGIKAEDIEPEKSFPHPEFSGKMDLACIPKKFIADIKTTDFTIKDGVVTKKNKKVTLDYPEHCIQLAGYAQGTGIYKSNPTLVNIYVSTLDDSVYVHEWEHVDIYRYGLVFQNLVEIWYAML